MGSNVACASVPLDLTNVPKQLFCRSTSVSGSSRLLLGLSRSFLGARLREQSLDLAAIKGSPAYSQITHRSGRSGRNWQRSRWRPWLREERIDLAVQGLGLLRLFGSQAD
jgi:hypothetical protein